MQQSDKSPIVRQLTERISNAHTCAEWVGVCVFFLQEMAQKNHPQTHDWGRTIDFFLQHIPDDRDAIWEEAHRIARESKTHLTTLPAPTAGEV